MNLYKHFHYRRERNQGYNTFSSYNKATIWNKCWAEFNLMSKVKDTTFMIFIRCFLMQKNGKLFQWRLIWHLACYLFYYVLVWWLLQPLLLQLFGCVYAIIITFQEYQAHLIGFRQGCIKEKDMIKGHLQIL